ncbi:hypothetical protein [Kribbella catacumbae]|uniref:hypothetical protein n=1 Tax=Kribbella catacumbae TaxID=460086 RepID=UPI00035F1162|nr:hypothetical protein [Kribbella catacumbae]
MKLYLVTKGNRRLWVAALAHENMYGYVQNTGYFHDNNALRNDFYLENRFGYEEIDITRAKALIAEGVGQADESKHADALAKWRADPRPLAPNDVFAAVAGLTP